MSDPYKITFHQDADGGPTHFLNLLVGYCVRLRKDDETLFDLLVESADDEGGITGRKFCDCCHEYCGERVTLNTFNGDFDEVMYL